MNHRNEALLDRCELIACGDLVPTDLVLSKVGDLVPIDGAEQTE